MSPLTVMALARDAGIRIGLDGDDLVLAAPCEPPAGIVDLLSRFKPDIVRCLIAEGSAGWTREDWLAYFDERAGIVEFDGGAPRAEAEAQAYRCCIAEWLNRHPTLSPAGHCVWCGVEESSGAVVVPFGTTATGHTWAHATCWPAWQAAREAEAAAALVEFGIHAPQGDRPVPDGGRQ